MWYDDWPQTRTIPVGYPRHRARAPARVAAPRPAPAPVAATPRPPAEAPCRADVPSRSTLPTPASEPARAPRGEDTARLREAIADLEAAKRRLAAEGARESEAQRLALAAELLPVLDDLDKTLAASGDSPDRPLVHGVELVRAQLAKVLAGYGAEPFPSAGAPFDPEWHEAVAVQPVDDPERDGLVLDEWRAGYRIGQRILRPAQVVVGRLTT